MSYEYDSLTFYRTRFTKQWRWKYQAQGNNRRLANGGESYSKLVDAVKGAFRVCDMGNPFAELPVEPEKGQVDTVVSTIGGNQVLVRFRP